jgi:hypothetical protein
MGALLDKLVEVAGIYNECRAAALGQSSGKPNSTTKE